VPFPSLKHDTYNVAFGKVITVKDLVVLVSRSVPGLKLEIAPPEVTEIKDDGMRRTGRWGAYDASRAEKDFGRKPRPLDQAMADYIAWLRAN
jgi:UDP-glucose 4-epimerase